MSRIFLVLSLLAISMLIANIVFGLRTGDLNEAAHRYVVVNREFKDLEVSPDATEAQIKAKKDEREKLDAELKTLQPYAVFHILFGVTAALITLLVNSISVTYFIGTNRWCREVVDTYGLDEDLALSAQKLKSSAFPFSAFGILIVLALIFTGGASMPTGANAANSVSWVLPHYIGALVGVGIIAWSLLVQVGKIGENYEVINKIVDEVARVRAERGLDKDKAGAGQGGQEK